MNSIHNDSKSGLIREFDIHLGIQIQKTTKRQFSAIIIGDPKFEYCAAASMLEGNNILSIVVAKTSVFIKENYDPEFIFTYACKNKSFSWDLNTERIHPYFIYQIFFDQPALEDRIHLKLMALEFLLSYLNNKPINNPLVLSNNIEEFKLQNEFVKLNTVYDFFFKSNFSQNVFSFSIDPIKNYNYWRILIQSTNNIDQLEICTYNEYSLLSHQSSKELTLNEAWDWLLLNKIGISLLLTKSNLLDLEPYEVKRLEKYIQQDLRLHEMVIK